jgi:hypothetical protein
MTTAKIELKPNKFKVINISRLKAYEEDQQCLSEDAMRLPQGDPSLFEDSPTNDPSRPMTRALKKLIDYKNAAAMAISILNNDLEQNCDGNIFAEGYDKYHCQNCYNGIKKFSHFACQTNVFSDPRNSIKFSRKINHSEGAFTNTFCELIKNFKYCKNDADQVQNDADPNIFNQPVIGAIKEVFRKQLTSIASKLLSSEHSKLEDLSLEEQNLWKSFDNSDIYEFITGKPVTLPEFQYNWIEPCQLAVHLPPGVQFASNKNFQLPPDPIKPPNQIAAPPGPVVLAVPPPNPPPQIHNQNQVVPPVDQPQVDQPQHIQDQQPVAGPSSLQPQTHQHDLRPRPELNYKELHTGIKQRCRKLCRQAKAVVTKLAPGSFSPKQPPPDPSSNQGPSS